MLELKHLRRRRMYQLPARRACPTVPACHLASTGCCYLMAISMRVEPSIRGVHRGDKLWESNLAAAILVCPLTLCTVCHSSFTASSPMSPKTRRSPTGVSIIFKIGVFYKAWFEGIEFFIVWPYAVFHKMQVVFYKSAHFMYFKYLWRINSVFAKCDLQSSKILKKIH